MQSNSESHLLNLSPGFIEKVRKIHNLDKPGRLEEAVCILEEWLQKQDHIIKKDFGKGYLERTLVTCKGSVEKTKKQIDRLCTMKTLLPKFFCLTNIKKEISHVLEIACIIPLPKLTKDYYRVIMLTCNDKKFTNVNFMHFYQYVICMCEYLKAHDYMNGIIVIDDFTQLNLFDVIAKLNTVEAQQFASILIEGFGARLTDVHVLTTSKAVDMFLKIIKQFISDKIGNRIHVRSCIEEVQKYVPKDILPVEYGGKERSIEKLKEEWIEALSSDKHEEYLKVMNKAGTDESKRLEGKFNEEYMGMPGSFRNLSVD